MTIEGVDPGLLFFLERIPRKVERGLPGQTNKTPSDQGAAVEFTSATATGGRVTGAQYERAAQFLLFLRGTLTSVREKLDQLRELADLPIEHATEPLENRWNEITGQIDKLAASEFEGAATFTGSTRALAIPAGSGSLGVPTADLRASSLGVDDPHSPSFARALAVIENMSSVLMQKTEELSRVSAPPGPDTEDAVSPSGLQDVLLENASAAVRAQTGALDPGLAFSLLRGI